jgi:hypothetical protein
MQDLTKVLAEADADLKAEVYTELGNSVKYDPVLRIVHVEAQPKDSCSTARVGGAMATLSTPVVWRTEWAA